MAEKKSAAPGLSKAPPAFAEAMALHRAGRLAEAQEIYVRILARQPDHFDSRHLLGVVHSQRGNYAEAVRQIDTALTINPKAAAALSNRGFALHELRRFDEAVASYDKAIALKPDYAEALYNRGNAQRELKRHDQALASYDKAIALKPDYAKAFNNRGNALQELKRFGEALASYDKAIALKSDYAEAFYNRGNAQREQRRFDEAVASFDQAIAFNPDYADAFNNRGLTLQELRRLDEALASYDQALALKPDYANAFNSRGLALRELKRLDAALASYDQAIALKPDYADAFNNRGLALHELKRLDAAVASYDQALTLKPDYAEAFNNRGAALHELKRLDAALASYDQAVALRPDYADAFHNRGLVLHELNRRDEALASYGMALTVKPDHAEAQFAMCMAELSIFYENEPEIVARRTAYERGLRALCDAGNRSTNLADFAKGIGGSQPFYLAYQGYNDRDLQALYGSLVCRVMAKCYPAAALVPLPRDTEPVRVGIVSGFFRQHSNWKLPIKGWLSQLDRRRFRIFGYHTGVVQDTQTKAATALCDRFVQGPLTIDGWRAEISADAPHVLIYPEVGMDAVSTQLAAQRLAPVQCNSWGHPDTSGFPTMDYYLSSDLMEPPDGQDCYTERLVRLPNLSVYCEPIDPPPASIARQDLGLRSTATVFWCAQSLYKYLPQFDEVFPRIAREAGDCQFAFIQYQKGAHITELFRKRLDRAFAAFGLNAEDHCCFLPRLDQHEFVAASGQCDIFLDSINWSGCNSTLESLVHDLPIVTMAGPLMRGRHSIAILRMMGVTETIAETIDDYVAIATRLTRDVPWRTAVKAKISACKHRIYLDRACIAGLEQFLNDAVRSRAPQSSPSPMASPIASG
jgi:protein O-GlcNAc transferase